MEDTISRESQEKAFRNRIREMHSASLGKSFHTMDRLETAEMETVIPVSTISEFIGQGYEGADGRLECFFVCSRSWLAGTERPKHGFTFIDYRDQVFLTNEDDVVKHLAEHIARIPADERERMSVTVQVMNAILILTKERNAAERR